MSDTNYVRTERAAEFLGLKRRTLEKWRCTGCGPRFRKLGGAVVYSLRELETWVEAQTRTSTSDPGTRRGSNKNGGGTQ